LLQGLRQASSPWERLGIVTRGARALTRLAPDKRRELLRRLGLSAADDLVGHLAGDAGPETREALHRALASLEQDPATSARLVRELADPATRDATLSGLIAHLEEAVTEAPQAPQAPDSGARNAPEAAPAAGSRNVPDAARASGSRPPAAGQRGPEDEDEEVPIVGRQPSAGKEAAEAPVTVVDVEWLEALAEVGGEEATATKAPEVATGLAELRELEQRLRGLPSGWARRRVLDRAIRGGLGADLDRALDLVRRFAEPGERPWCLTTLAASHSRSDGEWDRLLAAAETPWARRRLEMRRRRAGSG
jgi:hypothetical protein